MPSPQGFGGNEMPQSLKNADSALLASLFDQAIRQAGATGNLIHDAHIAALCLEHGVSELITGDRDFSRFEGLRIVNPFANEL